MTLSTLLKTIRSKVQHNEIGDAFKTAERLFEKAIIKQGKNILKYQNEIILQASFYSKNELLLRKSQISSEDHLMSNNIVLSNFLSTLDKIEEDQIDRNTDIILGGNQIDLIDGFEKDEVSEVMDKTAELIKDARHFRVVGVGRQYLGNVSNNNSINSYYSAIENRLADPTKEERFRYRRITIMELEEKFKTHLSNCFVNAEKSEDRNKAEIILLDNIEMQFTYYVIDTKLVIVNIYTISTENVLDCPYAFWSNNPTTINLFISHFDRAWRRETHLGNIISSNKEFDEFIPVNQEILYSLREIQTYLKKLPKNSSRTNWALHELNQTKKRLKGLTEYSLGIKNKVTNGKLLNIFSYYVRDLSAGDTYNTISFFEFWENITSEDTKEFYNANRTGLINGASITRIYIISNESLENKEYIKKQKMILEKHFALKNKFKKNYKFKMLFIDGEKHRRYLFDYKNFAIWRSKNEIILFRPEYINVSGTTFFPDMTYLHYINELESKHPNYNSNIELLRDSEMDYEEILKEQKVQEEEGLNEAQKKFLKQCGIRVEDL